MRKSETGKYGTLLGLYLAQSVPMSFFSTVVPVIMRQENFSLTSIGLLQLIKLPWIIKFLWAPFIDNQCDDRRKYRKWIVGSELFYAIAIISTGYFDLSTDFKNIIVFMVLAFLASATQDIATDAFAVLSLRKEERSLGNSMQSAGTFLGTLTGSGILLVLYHYFGWRWMTFCLGTFVLIALIPLLFFNLKHETERNYHRKKATLSDIFTFFRSKRMVLRTVFLIFIYSGLIGILTMLKPWMVDLKFSMKEIGFMAGVFGTAFGSLSAFLAGWILRRVSQQKLVTWFAFAAFLVAGYFALISRLNPDKVMIYIGIAALWGMYGMLSVLVYTSSMDYVRPGREGTDFTIQIVITHFSSMIIAIFSGKVAHEIGYKGLFFTEMILALLVIPIIYFTFKEKEEKHDYFEGTLE